MLSAAQLAQLCTLLQKEFGPISALPESTCEANPESLTPEKLTVLKNFGFTRLSLGLQSLDDKELKLLGRVHTRADFLRAYQAARAAGPLPGGGAGGVNNIFIYIIVFCIYLV